MPGPAFIADTGAIIGRIRKDPDIESFFTGKQFAITFVTLAELNVGVLKARNSAAAWKDVLEALRGVGMFLASALTPFVYAGVYRDLERQGHRIPLNDIWIAALCIEANLPLLARDAHFSRVSKLQVINC